MQREKNNNNECAAARFFPIKLDYLVFDVIFFEMKIHYGKEKQFPIEIDCRLQQLDIYNQRSGALTMHSIDFTWSINISSECKATA